jgi:hypothetical protein
MHTDEREREREREREKQMAEQDIASLMQGLELQELD